MSEFYNDQWRLPNEENKNKISNYSMYGDALGEINASSVPLSSESWTISVWLKPSVTTGTEIIWDMQYGSAGGFKLIQHNGTSTATAVWFQYYAPTYWYFNSQVTITPNNWHHVIVRYNKGVDYRIYVDGVFSGSSTTFNNYSYPTTRDLEIFKIGGFNGNLDQFCVFNYALSDTSTTVGDTATGQIATLYGDGSAIGNPMSLSPAPIAYYPLGDQDAFNGANYLVPNIAAQEADGDIATSYSPYALDFDGANDYINIPSFMSNLPSNEIYTISTWIKTSSDTNAAWGSSSTSNLLYAYVTNGTTLGIGRGSVGRVDISNLLIVGEWANLVAVFDSSTNLKIYINNVFIQDVTVGSLGTVTDDFKISGGLNGYNLACSQSNCSIWNSALTSSQVTEIYNEGVPSNLNNHSAYSNLISWWQLGSNSSFNTNWTVLDEKGSNNGTSVNMTEDDIVDGVGSYANGLSSGMGGDEVIGDAPYSSSNSLSVNMDVLDRVEDTPS